MCRRKPGHRCRLLGSDASAEFQALTHTHLRVQGRSGGLWAASPGGDPPDGQGASHTSHPRALFSQGPRTPPSSPPKCAPSCQHKMRLRNPGSWWALYPLGPCRWLVGILPDGPGAPLDLRDADRVQTAHARSVRVRWPGPRKGPCRQGPSQGEARGGHRPPHPQRSPSVGEFAPVLPEARAGGSGLTCQGESVWDGWGTLP